MGMGYDVFVAEDFTQEPLLLIYSDSFNTLDEAYEHAHTVAPKITDKVAYVRDFCYGPVTTWIYVAKSEWGKSRAESNRSIDRFFRQRAIIQE